MTTETNQENFDPVNDKKSNSEFKAAFDGGDFHDDDAAEKTAALGEEVLSLRTENSELKDRMLRTLADMENLKRRTEREKQENLKYSLERIMTDIVPVLDVFSSALEKTTNPDDAAQNTAIYSGMEMVHKQLLSTLSKHGLERHQSLGTNFDPNLHQAVQRVEDDTVSSEVVKQVYAEAYTLNGRLLRPAMVSVAVPKS